MYMYIYICIYTYIIPAATIDAKATPCYYNRTYLVLYCTVPSTVQRWSRIASTLYSCLFLRTMSELLNLKNESKKKSNPQEICAKKERKEKGGKVR